MKRRLQTLAFHLQFHKEYVHFELKAYSNIEVLGVLDSFENVFLNPFILRFYNKDHWDSEQNNFQFLSFKNLSIKFAENYDFNKAAENW